MSDLAEPHTLLFAHAAFKFLHVLLFVYWLGGDAGVFAFSPGATLRTAGTQSLTATDGAISGSQTNINTQIINPPLQQPTLKRARRTRRTPKTNPPRKGLL